MNEGTWFADFPAAITICDRDGKILAMNAKAGQTFAKEGGRELIGRNVLDCHPGAARRKLQDMLRDGAVNACTIEKNEVKKLIYQAPWYDGGELAGIVEIALELPGEIPHFIR